MKKWIAAMLLLALALFGSVIGFDVFKQQMIADYLANQPEAKLPVEVVEARSQDWQPKISSIGMIEPQQGVTLSTSVSGLVSKIHFSSGEQVEEGQLLVTLDSEVEQANLAAAKSRLPAAKSSYERNQQLYKRNSVSKKTLDDAQAEYLALRAEIDSLEAVIERREIRAPFSGMIGLREIHLGRYLQAGDAISRLESLDSMMIRFIVPQKNLPDVAIGMQVAIHNDAYPQRVFEGRISAINSAVSHESGVLQLQAEIPNSDQLLRAGMYATVDILQPVIDDAVVIPTRAINFSLYGEQVYVVSDSASNSNNDSEASTDSAEELRVSQRSIKVAERQGQWSRVTGIEAGDTVVTSGQVRLRNGALVKIVDDGLIDDGLNENAAADESEPQMAQQ